MYYIDISRKIGADIGLESNSQVLKQNKKKKKLSKTYSPFAQRCHQSPRVRSIVLCINRFTITRILRLEAIQQSFYSQISQAAAAQYHSIDSWQVHMHGSVHCSQEPNYSALLHIP